MNRSMPWWGEIAGVLVHNDLCRCQFRARYFRMNRMIVVSDTTPLNYLILVDLIDAVPGLFVRVYAPSAVITELSHSRAPESVRVWAVGPPEWLTVQDPTRTVASLKLGSGERSAAIAMGQELKADWILIHERKGTREAQGRGLRVAGTLTILEEAGGAGTPRLRADDRPAGERDDFPRHRSSPERLRAAIPRPPEELPNRLRRSREGERGPIRGHN